MIETSITWKQEAEQFFTHSGKSLGESQLMEQITLDPDEALAFRQEVRAIGHIRFGLWMDINRPMKQVQLEPALDNIS